MDNKKLLSLVMFFSLITSCGSFKPKLLNAETFNYYTNFNDHEVTDFLDYESLLTNTTYNLGAFINFEVYSLYKMNSCSTNWHIHPTFGLSYILFNNDQQITSGGITINSGIPLYCSTSLIPYEFSYKYILPSSVIEYISSDDPLYLNSYLQTVYNRSMESYGVIFTLDTQIDTFEINYSFSNTYQFNYFLSDSRVRYSNLTNMTKTGTPSFNYVQFIYSSAGEDEFYIYNVDGENVGTSQLKYAIDYPDTLFRGSSIGVNSTIENYGNYDLFSPNDPSPFIINSWRHDFLNMANIHLTLADAPQFEFTEQDCGWNAFNVPCFINNGMAYIVNDMPVVSDLFTVLNASIAFGAQAFGVIGNFNTDNLIGWLILVGFGITILVWLLKGGD